MLQELVRLLLHITLAIPLRFKVDSVLGAQVKSYVGLLPHFHVGEGELVFLHGCQLLLVRALHLLLQDDELVGLAQVVQGTSGCDFLFKLWLSPQD